MRPGTILADRFTIERLVGYGAMGRVYRAYDGQTGAPVALKILASRLADGARRFLREGKVLAELDHSGIVNYVAHGITPRGECYLAMEWLDGEDLASRLKRGLLSVDQTLTLLRRLSDALAAAHDRGIVHRDIKPNNVFLPDGRLERAKLIDFGIARALASDTHNTQPGLLLGSAGYLAPEQARALGEVDPRTDMFALGCLVFKCLTGRTPFEADSLAGVLSLTLFAPVPRLKDCRLDVPLAFDRLVARCTSRLMNARPGNAAQLSALLQGITQAHGSSQPEEDTTDEVTIPDEKLLYSVIHMVPTLDSSRSAGARMRARSLLDRGVAAIAERFNASAEQTITGDVVVVLSRSGPATDQARYAARCALALRGAFSDHPLALVLGRGRIGGSSSRGDVFARAAELARQSGQPGAIRIDELTAGLLDARFVVSSHLQGLWLQRERATLDESRRLLGKPTPCVGRARELGALYSLYRECQQQGAARAVVVIGPAGIGKSRLREELLEKLRADEPVAVWMARGDPIRAGSPFGLLSQALRSAVGIFEGETLEARRRKLRARVALRVPADEVERVAAFLGELVGAPFDNTATANLRAARQSSRLMGDQMQAAFVDFLAAEATAHPVLLVLEDLHSGDLPTVGFVDTALRLLRDRAFMVVALARPEIRDSLGELWAGFEPVQLPLGPLEHDSCATLVRTVLGDRVTEPELERLVERSGGNPYYLEELIRAAAAGQLEAMPETLVAMAQTRLEQLPRSARHVLQAASIYGVTFWLGGVATLLEPRVRAGVAAELEQAQQHELIVARPESKFPSEREFAFRHAMLREAAYQMLTDDSRRAGHRRAAQWLEKQGELDALTLAEHYERGTETHRAVAHCWRAAEQALEGNDLTAAIASAARGIEGGATGEMAGALLALQAEARAWKGELASSLENASAALQHLRPGTTRWYSNAAVLVEVAARFGHLDVGLDWAEALLSTAPVPNASIVQLVAVYRACSALTAQCIEGRPRIQALLHQADDRTKAGATEPMIEAARCRAHAWWSLLAEGDLEDYVRWCERAIWHLEQTGDQRQAARACYEAGFANLLVGQHSRAEQLSQRSITIAEAARLWRPAAIGRHNLGLALARLGRFDDAVTAETQALDAFTTQGDRRFVAGAHLYLAEILRRAGRLAEAEREIDAALANAGDAQDVVAMVLGEQARIYLETNRVAQADAIVAQALPLRRSAGEIQQEGEPLRLVHAEVLFAQGKRVAAWTAICKARSLILRRAKSIRDPELLHSYLHAVPDNARVLDLARQWADLLEQKLPEG